MVSSANRSENRKRHKSRQAHPLGDAPVLYIHPAKQGLNFRMGKDSAAVSETMGRPYHLMPVGMAALANLLQQNGIGVKGIVFPLECQLNPAFALKQWLRLHQGARVVLIDLHWYEHSYGALETARVARETLPEAWTVLGGLTASGFSKEILVQFPEVDFIIRGDAEKPLLELLPRLIQSEGRSTEDLHLEDIGNLSYRQDGRVVENECTYCAATEDLDRLNFADLTFLEHAKEYYVHEYIVTDLKKARLALETKPFWGRWITTARGCKYECSYCGGCKSAHKTLANREGIIIRSPARVVDDIVRLKNSGVIQASLTYDIAELGDAYWLEFFALLRNATSNDGVRSATPNSGVRNANKIGIYNEFFQLPKPAFIDEYARSVDMAHSCVALSPLSGSEKVRRLNGKLFSNDELFEILGLLNKHNFYTIVYFSLNLPGENEQTFQETLELAQDIYQFYPSSLLKILNTNHTLDPFSPMNLHPEKFGIETSLSSFMDYYNYCRNTGLAGPEGCTELNHGFKLKDAQARSLVQMADAWDKHRQGKEASWWPIPPGW
jgi:radical SAM superfamily enzyme YgiQ (UPF0313 family)